MNDNLGRVAEQHHNLYKVLLEDGTLMESRVAGKFAYQRKKNTDYPVVGDYVRLNEKGIIEEVMERKSTLQRMEAGTTKKSQIIVSNLDYIFICMAVNQDFNLRRLERYLSMVYGTSITPIILLMKSDLAEDIDQYRSMVREEQSDLIVIPCSSVTGEGITEVQGWLQTGMTAAFIGSSGIGKSTIVNQLLGQEVLKTSRIREYDGKGRHTTTHRQLVRLGNGSYLIDTPGMRGLALDTSNVAEAFGDIEQLACECKYRNCSHTVEDGCAIRQALEKGTISAKRYRSYTKLKREEQHRSKERNRVYGGR